MRALYVGLTAVMLWSSQARAQISNDAGSAARASLVALLQAEPGDARALDAAAASALPGALHSRDPVLRALQRLARARALLLSGRFDESLHVLADVRNQADALPPTEQRRVLGEARFREAEIEEARQRPPAPCDPLGLERLAVHEGRRAQARMEALTSRYRAVVKVGDLFWARRAAFRLATLSDDFYRVAAASAGNARGLNLPSPFALSVADTREILGPMFTGAWRAEISRLYAELLTSVEAREPDAVLLDLARARASAFARLELPAGERLHNPWLSEERPGLVRFNRRHERKTEGGAWAIIPPAAGAAAMAAQLALPLGSVGHAYALSGLADEGRAPPPIEAVRAALEHPEPRVRLAGLHAAERSPSPVLLEVLVRIAENAEGAARGAGAGPAFDTLQATLFGERERAVLALRALAAKDRDAAEKIVTDGRIPVRERAWLVAELGEPRLMPALQSMTRDRDPAVAATAIYALVVAAGRNAAGWLRPWDADVVGCVSRALGQELAR